RAKPGICSAATSHPGRQWDRRWLEFYDAAPCRHSDGVSPIGDIQLGEYVLQVPLDRFLGQAKLGGNLLVRLADRNELQDRDLAGRQRLVDHVQRNLVGDLAMDMALAAVDVVDRVDELGPQRALQQVADGTRLQCAYRLRVARVGGEHDDAGFGM